MQQLLLFNPGNTEAVSEPAAGIVHSDAVPREQSANPRGRSDNSRGLSNNVDPSPFLHDSPSDPAPAGRADRSTAVLFVRHPRARRYLIRVRTDGSVRVTIPRRGSKREAAAFYEQQQEWIARQQERVAQVRQTLPGDLPEEEQRAYRMKARRELPARLLELAAIAGVSVRRVSVRNQRQRWGSCSASGLICLNWRLITMPGWVRDYVLYHELMHLKRMDHSPAFWKLVAQVCPRYRDARRWLRRHALAPHAPEAHAEATGEQA